MDQTTGSGSAPGHADQGPSILLQYSPSYRRLKEWANELVKYLQQQFPNHANGDPLENSYEFDTSGRAHQLRGWADELRKELQRPFPHDADRDPRSFEPMTIVRIRERAASIGHHLEILADWYEDGKPYNPQVRTIIALLQEFSSWIQPPEPEKAAINIGKPIRTIETRMATIRSWINKLDKVTPAKILIDREKHEGWITELSEIAKLLDRVERRTGRLWKDEIRPEMPRPSREVSVLLNDNGTLCN
ncbi:hypothetical protein QBC35DRAFT_22869 [Podospora australis]|uniref:Uncharacterized protein n=1 Tax=Podospora australis TaxID=1536484 RepID=A0AAN6X0R4_9PEZI|nr:hypothetical protein QBC35DRAFT_22869 [Podospora australis]